MYIDAAHHTMILISKTRWNVYCETLRAIYVTKCVCYTYLHCPNICIKMLER